MNWLPALGPQFSWTSKRFDRKFPSSWCHAHICSSIGDADLWLLTDTALEGIRISPGFSSCAIFWLILVLGAVNHTEPAFKKANKLPRKSTQIEKLFKKITHCSLFVVVSNIIIIIIKNISFIVKWSIMMPRNNLMHASTVQNYPKTLNLNNNNEPTTLNVDSF